jgi:hypothetical protein
MIYLYRNKLPNYDENTHYFFTNSSDYVSALGEPALSFEEDRYTLNGNIAEVKTPLITDVDNVTYIAWYNVGAWRFFFVRSAVYQSGYVIFTLDVDLWATNIARATLSNIRVTRCNRNVGVGVYDPIPSSVGREFLRLGGAMSADDLAIVYVVAFATGVSSILVNNAGTSMGVFVQEMNNDVPEGTNAFDNWLGLVSGIYSAQATIGDLDANVLKAYIVPKSVLAVKTGTVPIFNVKTPSFSGTLTPTYEAAPFIFPVRFDIDIDPNKKYFVGTKHAGVELVRTTQPTSVIYNYIVKQDGLQVIVQQGDRMLDITDAFAVGLTSNDGNFTATERVARTLQVVGGIASGAFQIMQGGAGYVTGALTAANALTSVVEQGNARYAQGGDGVSTFRALTGAAQSPYYIQVNESINNEAANARLYGATFNQQVESIDDIFVASLLGTGTLTDTYFAAEVRVDGVQTEARDVISAAIRGGIYAVKL